MDFNVHVFIHSGDDVVAAVRTLTSGVNAMSIELDSLKAAVEKNTAADQSAIVLLQGLSAQIVAMKNDPVALQALANTLDASAQSLADAVLANTPATADPAPVV